MRLYLSSVIVILTLLLAACGGDKGPDGLVQAGMSTLQGQLDLTPTQIQAIETILADGMTRLRDMVDNPDDDRRAARKALRDMEQSVREQVSDVLDDNQRELLEEAGIRLLPSTTLVELDNRLDLSPEQIGFIEEILMAAQEEIRRARDEQGDGQRFDRERMMEMRERRDADIADMLNESQLSEYEKMLEERMVRMEARRGNWQP